MFYYRGGKICLTDHFKPLWARNVPKFGIAHAMALGVSSIFSRQKNLQLILFILSHISLPSIVHLYPHPFIVIACYFWFCICFNFWYISNFLPTIICSTCISSLHSTSPWMGKNWDFISTEISGSVKRNA